MSEVETILNRAERDSPVWPSGRHVVSVSRRGSGQETELVVHFADVNDTGEHDYFRTCFPMHGYRTEEGERLPIAVIASIVKANVEEPVRRPSP